MNRSRVDLTLFTVDDSASADKACMSAMGHLIARSRLEELGAALAFQDSGRPTATDPLLDVTISHSRGIGVVAVGRSTRVGVDLETPPWYWDESVARRVCTQRELSFVVKGSLRSRDVSWRVLWTRKEACLKLWGVGLGMSPSRIDVLDDLVSLACRSKAAEVYLRSWIADGAVLSLATTSREPTIHFGPPATPTSRRSHDSE